MTATPECASQKLRSARVSQQPPRLRATLLALGIIFALAYVFFLHSPPSIPTPDVASIQGTYILVRNRETPAPGATPRPASTRSGSFAALAAGDAGGTMWTGPSTQVDAPPVVRSTYEADLRTEVTIQILGAGTHTRKTVDAWPPVWRVATPSPLDYQGLAAVVRSAVEDNDPAVGIKPLKDGDRPVWRAAMKIDGSTVELVVDQKTGVVVWCLETNGSRTDTFSAIPAWAATPSRDQLSGTSAAAGSTGSHDVVETLEGTDYTYAPSLEAAGRRAGYIPLASGLAPDGFALKAVATVDDMGAPGAGLVSGPSAPPIGAAAVQSQVAQLYTRGLSWFTVRQVGPRAAGTLGSYLRETLPSLAADKLSFETAKLQYGAFAGSTAFTWYERSGPTLFVSDARHIAYVTGALTRQELITFAEGLKPLGSGVSASPASNP